MRFDLAQLQNSYCFGNFFSKAGFNRHQNGYFLAIP